MRNYEFNFLQSVGMGPSSVCSLDLASFTVFPANKGDHFALWKLVIKAGWPYNRGPYCTSVSWGHKE